MGRKVIVIVSFVMGLAWLPVARAAEPVIQLGRPVGTIRLGETMTIDVQLDSAGREINAAEVHLRYDPAALEVAKIAREQSIFSLWPEPPAWDASLGEVVLTGGRPNGIVSYGGTIATVYFKARRSGATVVRSDGDSSALYLNDGRGTRLSISPSSTELVIVDPLVNSIVLRSSTHPTPESWSRQPSIVVDWDAVPSSLYSYALSQDRQATPDDTPEVVVGHVAFNDLADGIYYFVIKEKSDQSLGWSAITQRRFLIDSTAPEPFALELVPPTAVNGQPLLAWQAYDASSGVLRSELSADGQRIGEVTSPYAIPSAWRGKKLSVTVFDQAGNVRTAELTFAAPTRSRLNPLILVWLGLGVLAASIGYVALRRRNV